MRIKLINISLTVILCLTAMICWRKYQPTFSVNTDYVLLHNCNSESYYYQFDNSNRGICDLSTVSLICDKMIADGFSIAEEISDESSIDVTLIKGDIIVRMNWEQDGNFATICNNYEKSYLPLTYISDENVNDNN